MDQSYNCHIFWIWDPIIGSFIQQLWLLSIQKLARKIQMIFKVHIQYKWIDKSQVLDSLCQIWIYGKNISNSVSFTTACRKISMCILLFYSCDFFKVIKKGYMCISNNRTKHGFHVFLLILSRDARSGIMISSLGSKCQHFKVGMPVFQPFYDMKLKTSKFKVLAFWIQWRYHHQIQITRSSYHKNQILKCYWEWPPSLSHSHPLAHRHFTS